jgi:peptidoglycan/xylan/chitin deacetylase (PgdA/CDA1 family)
VNPDKNFFSIKAIPPRLFEEQMAYLRKHFSVLSLYELLQGSQDRSLPSNSVAVTFDDGYRDNYTFALPILKKYRIPATIFLTTGCIETGQVLWFDKILLAFRKTTRLRLEVDDSFEPISWRTTQERLAAATKILRQLRERPDDDKDAMLPIILDSLGVRETIADEEMMLTWEQVREMYDHGISFGSHTVTHPILSRCSEKRILSELTASKHTIEEQIENEVDTLAYPSGRKIDFSEMTIRLAKEAGYRGAVTILAGPNNEGEDPFLLRRDAPAGYSLASFALDLGRCKLKRRA